MKHGMGHMPIYNVWVRAKGRCYNIRNPKYPRYGGRGICMCAEWKDDFIYFYIYVSELINYGVPGYTLDRIDNDGNYEPGNVRWATGSIQSSNRGLSPRNTSGYTGVVESPYNRWIASIKVNGEFHYLGNHINKKEAVTARNQFIIDNNLPHKTQEWKD